MELPLFSLMLCHHESLTPLASPSAKLLCGSGSALRLASFDCNPWSLEIPEVKQ